MRMKGNAVFRLQNSQSTVYAQRAGGGREVDHEKEQQHPGQQEKSLPARPGGPRASGWRGSEKMRGGMFNGWHGRQEESERRREAVIGDRD